MMVVLGGKVVLVSSSAHLGWLRKGMGRDFLVISRATYKSRYVTCHTPPSLVLPLRPRASSIVGLVR